LKIVEILGLTLLIILRNRAKNQGRKSCKSFKYRIGGTGVKALSKALKKHRGFKIFESEGSGYGR